MKHNIVFQHDEDNVALAIGISPEREKKLDAAIHQVLHSYTNSPVNCDECPAKDECDLKSDLPEINTKLLQMSRVVEYFMNESNDVNEFGYMMMHFISMLTKAQMNNPMLQLARTLGRLRD